VYGVVAVVGDSESVASLSGVWGCRCRGFEFSGGSGSSRAEEAALICRAVSLNPIGLVKGIFKGSGASGWIHPKIARGTLRTVPKLWKLWKLWKPMRLWELWRLWRLWKLWVRRFQTETARHRKNVSKH